tara:strand:- start:58 stop:261 length:204 start_codon:yes stop_codon:yes gene_type:complete
MTIEKISLSKKYCDVCEEDKNEIECNDIIGDITGIEGVSWYHCPDLVCEGCGEEMLNTYSLSDINSE